MNPIIFKVIDIIVTEAPTVLSDVGNAVKNIESDKTAAGKIKDSLSLVTDLASIAVKYL